jgi:hypothetical protein
MEQYTREEGGSIRCGRKTYDKIADRLGVSQAARSRQRGGEPAFDNELRWARQDMVEDGTYLHWSKSGRGIWKLAKP